MSYSVIQPPFTLQFRDMSRKELVAYAAWFRDSTPYRVAELAKSVKSTSHYEKWEPDITPESLRDLGQWMEAQIETRAREPGEIAEIQAKLTFPIEIPVEELTNRSFSVAMDIGMYFAQVVLRNLPGSRWDQPFGSKRFADYGQPVISGFGAAQLNPVGVMITTAYRVAGGAPADLQGLYDTWAGMVR